MRFFCFLLLILIAAFSPAQAQKYKRTLRGEVRIAGHPPQYYYIYYTANGANITGYSITQSASGDLKAALIGRLSDDGEELYLRETQSMDYDEPGMVLCFFAARLKLSKVPGRRVWSGPFSSRQPDGSPCDGGVMTFIDLDPTPPPPPKPVAPKTTPPRPKPRPTPPKETPKPETPKPAPRPAPETIALLPVAATTSGTVVLPQPRVRLNAPLLPPAVARPAVVATPPKVLVPPTRKMDTAALQNTYLVKSDSLHIEIWDGVENDGDVISLHYNGQEILTNEKLSSERRVLVLPITAGVWNTLTVFLLAEGNIPENTVALTLKDGTDSRDLSINGLNGQVANLFFKKTER